MTDDPYLALTVTQAACARNFQTEQRSSTLFSRMHSATLSLAQATVDNRLPLSNTVVLIQGHQPNPLNPSFSTATPRTFTRKHLNNLAANITNEGCISRGASSALLSVWCRHDAMGT